MLPRLAHRLPFAVFWLAACLVWLPAAGQDIQAGAVVQTPQVRAELLAFAPQGVPLGADAVGASPVWLGLQLTHQPGWHTYWKNAGDSGIPTELAFTLPPGVQAGETAWPLPKKIPIGPLVNYGYEDTVLLPVPLTVTPEYRPGPLDDAMTVRLQASWLVCKVECLPQEGSFMLKLPLHGSTALAGAAFEAAFKAQPAPLAGQQSATLMDDGQRIRVRIEGLPAALRGQPLDVWAETPGVLLPAAQPVPPGQTPGPSTWSQRWDGAAWLADLPVSPERSLNPDHLPLLLLAGAQAWRADAQVQGGWPAPAAAEHALPTLSAAPPNASALPASPASPSGSFLLALLGALLGGMVLNLMPCVFPVLAIKVLGFARHAKDWRAHRASGLAYSCGVLLSFLALGALMLGLRAAGEQLGWGFQLQSPWVVAGLAALFTVIGLNLAGMFEFASFAPAGMAHLQARHPLLDALLSGVLAVAIASPCTAPYMGAAIGLAVALPAWQALAIFAALGLGMALPYLLASWLPQVARLLPRPGAWMQVFRQFMAFPMFATVAWLLWVLGQQSGIDGAASLLGLLVLLAMLLWALGLASRARWWLAGFALAALVLLAGAIGHNLFKTAEPGANADAAADAGQPARWQPWSPQVEQAALVQGKPVFVDFTAAWCVTCQYNKKTTLANAQVLRAFDARGVQTLRADWTRRDAAISAELQRLGRSGVPVYLLQAPGREPVLLSELPSVGEVLAALESVDLK
ncbi:MAG: thioredoxin family protein [Burkholderiaceae bacterium]|jgi:thiol:disulfide interchange protein DsbD|nr:thioredoxin family protein [Burkholderiaceae bacterium]